MVLATFVLVATGPSYAEPLGSTSIPTSLADDEKRLMPKVMTEFYGSFDKQKACWISTKSGPQPEAAPYMWGVDKGNTVNVDITYCMKPTRLDVIKSNGRKMLFVVAGGNFLDEDGRPQASDPAPGILGLIVLTPNGANLGLVGTNDLYEGYMNYGGYPEHDTVTVHKLGPNGRYGWVAKLGYAHSNREYEWVQLYGLIGNSVKLLTAFVTDYSGDNFDRTNLSVNYAFETHSSASSFYPIVLRVSGIREGRPFRSNYRLVFDDMSRKYLTPKNMPEEIESAASTR